MTDISEVNLADPLKAKQQPHYEQDEHHREDLSIASTPSSLLEEEKKFICPHCNHSFTRKHNLKSHLLIHTREKPFHCSICSSKFRRLHDLKRHEKLHTGEKPYQCKNCGRKFARMDALVRHNNSQSGCTILIDDSVLGSKEQEHEEEQENDVHRDVHRDVHHDEVQDHARSENLDPPPSSQHASHQNQSSAPAELPSGVLQTASQTQSQHAQQRFAAAVPEPPKKSYGTAQWKLNNHLPSINRLTPLISTINETQRLPPQNNSSERLNAHQNYEQQGFDLLPYVKLLESRVSSLETKLAAAETKLAQLTYTVHNNISTAEKK